MITARFGDITVGEYLFDPNTGYYGTVLSKHVHEDGCITLDLDECGELSYFPDREVEIPV